MTGKEALKELMENIDINSICDLPWEVWIVRRLNIIKKDLDRLEELEKKLEESEKENKD